MLAGKGVVGAVPASHHDPSLHTTVTVYREKGERVAGSNFCSNWLGRR